MAEANKDSAAFLRNVNKKKKQLAEAAKKEQAGTFMDDNEIIEALGLSETKKQLKCKLTRVRCGVDKNKKEYVSINFAVDDGEHRGTVLSKFHGLVGKTDEKTDAAYNRLMGDFQRLDYDTTKWKPAEVTKNIVATAEELTEAKPLVKINAYTWGDDADNPRLGLDIVAIISGETKEDDDQYEPADDDSSDVPAGPADPDEWIDWGGTIKGEKGEEIEVWAKSFDTSTGMWTLEDSDGEVYEAGHDDVTWDEES